MRKILASILLFSFFPAISFAADNYALIESLEIQIAMLENQILALQSQLRQYSLENPVHAVSVPGEKWQVALQVGHWKMDELPWELRNLDESRQAKIPGKYEWEVNLAIAQKTKEFLEEKGVGVTLLPAALPGIYKADAFVAIHADQNPSLPNAMGYKVAASAFDLSGKAKELAQSIRQEYRIATWLPLESYVPDTMTHYYAFNSDKFFSAVHPETPAVIIETGYLPNPIDQGIIVKNPQLSARGIAEGIYKFLESK